MFLISALNRVVFTALFIMSELFPLYDRRFSFYGGTYMASLDTEISRVLKEQGIMPPGGDQPLHPIQLRLSDPSNSRERDS
jgi:hypothetical protein